MTKSTKSKEQEALSTTGGDVYRVHQFRITDSGTGKSKLFEASAMGPTGSGEKIVDGE